MKILWKALVEWINKYLPILICGNQTAYVDGRVISEGGILTLGILHTTNLKKQKVILMTVDIQKAFNSINIFLFFCVRELLFLGKCQIGRSFTKQFFIIVNPSKQWKLYETYETCVERKIWSFKERLLFLKRLYTLLNYCYSKNNNLKTKKLQKEFFWSGSTPKIIRSTLRKNYENGDLKK